MSESENTASTMQVNVSQITFHCRESKQPFSISCFVHNKNVRSFQPIIIIIIRVICVLDAASGTYYTSYYIHSSVYYSLNIVNGISFRRSALTPNDYLWHT